MLCYLPTTRIFPNNLSLILPWSENMFLENSSPLTVWRFDLWPEMKPNGSAVINSFIKPGKNDYSCCCSVECFINVN